MEPDHKKKVLMVHNYYQIPGGEDTVVANEKRLLEEHGHEVILYTRHNNELKNMSLFQKLGLPLTTIFNPRTYRDIRRIIKEEKIEIVHVHNTLNLISPAVYYAAVKMKIPVVQTVHNFRFLCPGATFYRDGHICEDCVSKGLGCAIKHKCYRNSRAQTLICVISTWFHRHTGILGKIYYIALTEFNKEKLLQLKQIKADNVFVKPNFTFEVSKDNCTKTKEEFYLFIGRIEEIKGVRILIDAFSRMPKKKVKLAGAGPLLEELKKKVLEEKIDNIEFLGFLSKSELDIEMNEAKAVILPTQVYEGFPMTIVEAFAHFKPVITVNVGNAGCMVEDRMTGAKFMYNDADSLIQVVNEFEKLNIQELGHNAREKYLKSYTSQANYELLDALYETLRGGISSTLAGLSR